MYFQFIYCHDPLISPFEDILVILALLLLILYNSTIQVENERIRTRQSNRHVRTDRYRHPTFRN